MTLILKVSCVLSMLVDMFLIQGISFLYLQKNWADAHSATLWLQNLLCDDATSTLKLPVTLILPGTLLCVPGVTCCRSIFFQVL